MEPVATVARKDPLTCTGGPTCVSVVVVCAMVMPLGCVAVDAVRAWVGEVVPESQPAASTTTSATKRACRAIVAATLPRLSEDWRRSSSTVNP